MIRTFYLYYILNALTGVIKKYIISNTKGFYFIQVLSDVSFFFYFFSFIIDDGIYLAKQENSKKLPWRYIILYHYSIISAQKSGPRMLDSYTFKQRELFNVALTGNRDTLYFFLKYLTADFHISTKTMFMCYNYSKLFYFTEFYWWSYFYMK